FQRIVGEPLRAERELQTPLAVDCAVGVHEPLQECQSLVAAGTQVRGRDVLVASQAKVAEALPQRSVHHVPRRDTPTGGTVAPLVGARRPLAWVVAPLAPPAVGSAETEPRRAAIPHSGHLA